jgi:hypothetical protein
LISPKSKALLLKNYNTAFYSMSGADYSNSDAAKESHEKGN